MIIKCQEHYNKVVEYAKSIGDNTLQQCIERLQQWEKNSNGKYEILKGCVTNTFGVFRHLVVVFLTFDFHIR